MQRGNIIQFSFARMKAVKIMPEVKNDSKLMASLKGCGNYSACISLESPAARSSTPRTEPQPDRRKNAAGINKYCRVKEVSIFF